MRRPLPRESSNTTLYVGKNFGAHASDDMFSEMDAHMLQPRIAASEVYSAPFRHSAGAWRHIEHHTAGENRTTTLAASDAVAVAAPKIRKVATAASSLRARSHHRVIGFRVVRRVVSASCRSSFVFKARSLVGKRASIAGKYMDHHVAVSYLEIYNEEMHPPDR